MSSRERGRQIIGRVAKHKRKLVLNSGTGQQELAMSSDGALWRLEVKSEFMSLHGYFEQRVFG